MRRTAAARVKANSDSQFSTNTLIAGRQIMRRGGPSVLLGRLDSGGLSLLRIKQASVACSQMALHLNAPSPLSSRGHKVLTRNFVVAPQRRNAKASCNLCCCQINRMNLTRRTSSPKAGMGVHKIVGQKCNHQSSTASCCSSRYRYSYSVERTVYPEAGESSDTLLFVVFVPFGPTTQDGLHIPSRCGQGGRSQEEDRRREHQHRESAPCRSGFGDVAIGEEV